MENTVRQWTPVKGWESPQEQGLFVTLAKSMMPRCIVEIGSEHGMSASIWVKYAPLAHIYCVEINPDSQFLQNLENAGLSSHRIEWLLGDSSKVEIPYQLKENPIDILFVDGDHSYEAALKDLQRWSKLVQQHGVILVHDCACSTNKNPHEQHYAVYSAVKKFLIDSPEWRVSFCVDSTMVLVRA